MHPGRLARILSPILLAVLVGTLAGGPVQAAPTRADQSADQSAEEELAETYAPRIVVVRQDEPCGPGEPYVPVDVDPLLGNDSVALRGPWTSHDLVSVAPTAEQLGAGLDGYALDFPGDALKPGCTYEKWVDRLWGRRPQPTVYAHVATQKGVTDRIAVQYWFFYAYNDYNNKHEGDWERIQVEFPAGDAETALQTGPDEVFYSQHYGSERAVWGGDKLRVEDGTHPVVYVSAGSHASQYSEGVYLGRNATEGFGCDTTVGPHDELEPAVVTIPSDPAQAAAELPWTSYRGHWGETGSLGFYEGPVGPFGKGQWRKPFAWSSTARDHSFSMPGAEVAGNRASEYFCGLVGGGSDVFRRFTTDPGPVLLVLLGVLLVLGWVVRRSGWQEARPLPAVVARRPGQVVGAALRMLGAHRRIFLLVAAPAAAASVASSLLTAVDPPVSSVWWGALSAVVAVVLVVALTWGQLATTQAVLDLDGGRTPTASTLLRDTRARVPALLATVVVWAAVIGLFLITGVLSLVAIVLIVAWSLALPVVQAEGLSGWRALRRSSRLVRRQLLTVLLTLAISTTLVTVLGGVLAALVFATSPAPYAVVSGIPQLVTTLVWPVTALLGTYAWANGRARETVDTSQVAHGER